ncbi:MAG: hypothetical protein U0V70_01370 [Terriglobia bacterium]
MKKQVLILNLILLALCVWLGIQVKRTWVSYQTTHNPSFLKAKLDGGSPASKPVSGLPPVVSYAPLVENNLFSPDRTNVVPQDPAASQKTMPPKPVLMGIMGFVDDPVALMVSGDPKASKDYQRIRKGGAIDGYQLLKFDDQKVVMNFDGKEVEVRLNEPSKLVPRDVAAQELPGTRDSQVNTVGQSPAATDSAPATSAVSAPRTETVPVGTVVNGRVKKIVPSPFGPMEAWVDVKQQ